MRSDAQYHRSKSNKEKWLFLISFPRTLFPRLELYILVEGRQKYQVKEP